jgi:hypothetical protein
MLSTRRSPTRRTRTRPALEILEDRAVPANFGVPWSDPTHLTLSFVPDGTVIAGHTSTLFQSLDTQMPQSTWQTAILQAFQTWAVAANINIGLVADDGAPFGTPGPSQHDPRFGDIRVGAQLMAPDSLSVSIPNDGAMSGTWSGDMLLNSSDQFGPQALNLFAVALHEAGHVLGLPDRADPKSPMSPNYAGITTLDGADLTTIRSLYGARNLHGYEGTGGSHTFATSVAIPVPSNYDGGTPLVAYGDLGSSSDVDMFHIHTIADAEGTMSIRLQSAGISLLNPRLTVYDARGTILGDSQAFGNQGGVVTLSVSNVDSDNTFYIEVRDSTTGVFGAGSYGIGITFDASNSTTVQELDAVLRSGLQGIGPDDIRGVFEDPSGAYLNDDRNGGPGPNQTLSPMPGYQPNSYYQTIGSLATATDVHTYKVQAPAVGPSAGLVLTATAWAYTTNGTMPRLALEDAQGTLLPARILSNGDGRFTIQAAGLLPGVTYTVVVAPNSRTSPVTGNFGLAIQFGKSSEHVAWFTSDQLDTTQTSVDDTLYIGRSQLFEFLLSASTVGTLSPGSSVLMQIFDANGTVVYSLIANADDVASSSAVFLTPGPYTVSFTLQVAPGQPAPVLDYNLYGESISDGIGPALNDPTLKPIYASPTQPGMFAYPNGTVTWKPFLLAKG